MSKILDWLARRWFPVTIYVDAPESTSFVASGRDGQITMVQEKNSSGYLHEVWWK